MSSAKVSGLAVIAVWACLLAIPAGARESVSPDPAAQAREEFLATEAQLGPSAPDTLVKLARLGMLLRRTDAVEAEFVARDVLARVEKAYGTKHPETDIARNNLGRVLITRRCHPEAEELLAELVKSFGSESNEYRVVREGFRTALAECLNLLGTDATSRAAEYHAQLAWATLAALEGDGSASARDAALNYVQILQANHSEAAAEEILYQILWDETIANLPPDRLTVRTLNNLGEAVRRAGRLGEASELLNSAYELGVTLFGPSDRLVDIVENNLGLVEIEQGRWSAAEQRLRAVFERRRGQSGVENPNTVLSMENLAGALLALERVPEALELFSHAYELDLKLLGEPHERTIRTCSNVALAFSRLERLEEAEHFYRSALAASERFVGAAHPMTIRIGVNLVNILHARAGSRWTDESSTLAIEFHQRVSGALGTHHPLYAVTATTNAERLMAIGAFIRARDLLESALPGFEANHVARGVDPLDRINSSALARPYALLAELDLLEDDYSCAWEHLERDRARVLEELVAQDSSVQTPEAVGRDLYEGLNAQSTLITWVVSHTTTSADGPSVWGCLVRRGDESRFTQLAELDHDTTKRVRSLGAMLRRLRPSDEAVISAQVAELRSRYVSPVLALADGGVPLTRIIVVPSPPFAELPAALLFPGVETCSAPSETVFQQLVDGSVQPPVARRLVVVGASPSPSSASLALPHEAAELALVTSAETIPPVVLTGARALADLRGLSKSGELAGARALHFVGHVCLRRSDPLESYILLSDGARITVRDLRELSLPGLVIVAGCESGGGKNIGGEGNVGFAHALMPAGARTLILANWMVDDAATMLLMARLHENLRREGHVGGPAASLMDAQAWLREQTLETLLSWADQRKNIEGLDFARRQWQEQLTRVGPDYRPYRHPGYWAAFSVSGAP